MRLCQNHQRLWRTVMSKVITGIFDTPNKAAHAIQTIESRGFRPDQISLITSDGVDRDAFTIDSHSKLAEGAAIGAASGGAAARRSRSPAAPARPRRAPPRCRAPPSGSRAQVSSRRGSSPSSTSRSGPAQRSDFDVSVLGCTINHFHSFSFIFIC